MAAEYLLLITLGLAGVTVYSMYQYFNALYCTHSDLLLACVHKFNKENMMEIDKLKDSMVDSSYIDDITKRLNVFEHQIKDGIQANAICCKSGMDKIRTDINKLKNRIAALEFPKMEDK